MYPGQGSQRPGMGKELLGFPWAREILKEAEEILGYPPAGALDDPERLKHTEHVQPLVFLVEWLTTEAIKEAGTYPEAVCGHSLGEYAALAAAGVIPWEEAFRLVVLRGRLMEEAARERPGAMAAIIAPQKEVERIAARAGCFPVNYNAPEQVVVSGEKGAVERAVVEARSRGYRAVPLRVSGAFHTPLMHGAEKKLREAMERIEFRSPEVAFVSAVSGRPERDPVRVKELMEKQMTSPVRWVEVVRSLEGLGIREAAEVGPGEVLARLGRKITPRIAFRTWREYVGI